ncbi:phage shock protein A [Catalinimonas alkaloidigena]|uniref:PspA/IM30 family protein n=1 Tax=Catalinimonas alkaloidigena TaxID=1075417 RepID=UPI00240743DD|nr:PspA/IM30 family protein [Catalinimonas alkaloidigena]MDF9800438.1 phage shock protein A [Catalinimonas alkaloidigena]
MSIFRRLFKVGEAQTHSLIDNMEDPVKMSEQAIRDLKQDLGKAMESLAEVKAIAIRTRRDMKNYEQQSGDYEKKAMLLLQRAEQGQIDPTEADRLATEALNKKEHADQEVARTQAEVQKYDNMTANLEAKVNELRSNISKWENELRTLKARSKVSTATKKLNKQMAGIDSSSTVSMLERMKTKVEEEESLAQSYGEIASAPKSVDDEIDKALGSSSPGSSDKLAALKAKMGINKDQ